MKVVFTYAGYENIGIESLSAVLKRAGHQTSLVFDPQLFNDKFLSIGLLKGIYNIEEGIVREIIRQKPDLVAFSVISSDWIWASRIAKRLKQLSDVPTVFGGIHASATPRKIIEKSYVDFVVVGEGEYPLLELVEELEGKRNFHSVKNLLFKEDGEIVANPTRSVIRNLDDLPFADKQLYYDQTPFFSKEYSIVTRRGCLNACTYCHNSMWRSRYMKKGDPAVRIRSVDHVMEELRERYALYHFNKLRVNDDLFTSDKQWLEEFSERYSREFDVPIWCYLSAPTVDEDVVRMLKRINCYQVSMGVQTIDPVVRADVCHRYDTNEKIAEAISLFSQYGIRCITDNIIGLPGQNEEELLELAKFYLENPVDRICIFWLIYFPATKIVDIGLERGAIDENTVKQIEEEPVDSANTHQNIYNSDRLIRYNLLLLSIHLLPNRIVREIIDRKIYERFPLINPSLIESTMTFFMKDRKEIERVRYIKRYWHYGPRIPLGKLQERIKSAFGKRHG